MSRCSCQEFLCGAANANNETGGEVIGIPPVLHPDEVKSGLEQAMYTIEHEAAFVSVNEDDSIMHITPTVVRQAQALSVRGSRNAKGEARAYLIALPLESMYGLDAALKAADVRLCERCTPPSENKFRRRTPDRNAVCPQIRVRAFAGNGR